MECSRFTLALGAGKGKASNFLKFGEKGRLSIERTGGCDGVKRSGEGAGEGN